MSARDIILSGGGGSAAPIYVVDPYGSNVSLLLKGNGTNGSQNNTYIDSSVNNATINIQGTPSQGTEGPFINSGSSYFDGIGDYLYISNSSNFSFYGGDFTIEWNMYCSIPWTSMNNPGVAGQKANDGTNGWQIYRNGSHDTDKVNIRITSSNDYHSNVTPTTNVWEHWAVVRSGTTLYWFKNGYLTNTHYGVSWNIEDTVGSLRVGSTQTWGGFFNGYIANLRILKGTALYTSNFIPPTSTLTAITNTQLLLKFNNAGIIDSTEKKNLTVYGNTMISTDVKKFGTGSIYFGGNGGITRSRTDSDMLLNGDFTIEMWLNIGAASAGYRRIFSNTITSDLPTGFIYLYHNGTNLVIYNSSIGTLVTVGTFTINSWFHLALVKNSNVFKVYTNGVLSFTLSNMTTAITANGFTIGGANSTELLTGYIDDFRITKDVARYTSNFTLPTAL